MKNIWQILLYGIIAFVLCAVPVSVFLCNDFCDVFSVDDRFAFSSVQIENVNRGGIVYIDGAVLYCGYYAFEEGETYSELFERVGLIENVSVFSTAPLDSFVSINDKYLYLDFFSGGTVYSSFNINSKLFSVLAQEHGISQDIIDKICQYKNQKGTMSNKNEIKSILTKEQWQSIFYKICVGQSV